MQLLELRSLLVAGWLLVGAGCHAPADSAAPNIVIVVIDTLRADHVSHYGYARDTGRGLDPFASHSILFEKAYATSSWTGPSTVSILSGLTPSHHWAAFIDRASVPKPTSLAETLRGKGWRTGAISANWAVSEAAGFARGFDWFVEARGAGSPYPDVGRVLTLAARWISRSPKPFFLYLQPMNVHGPYFVPPRHESSLLGRQPPRRFVYWQGPMREAMSGKLEARREVDDAYLQSLTDQYDSAIRYTFDRLGEFFAKLESMGVYDDTLIIVTADHGEELFDHGGFSHGFSLHEELVRVPLYLKPPGSRSGGRVDELVSVIDIAPTVLDAVGYAAITKLDGVSLLQMRERSGQQAVERDVAFQVQWPKRCTARGIRSGRHKLLRIEENYEGVRDEVRLFDLIGDPQEKTNLAETNSGLVAELSRRLDRLVDDDAGRRGPLPQQLFEGVDVQALRTLGYL